MGKVYKSNLRRLARAWLFTIAALVANAGPAFSHGDEVHEEVAAKDPLPKGVASENYLGRGQAYELAIETSVEGGAILYLTTRVTNAPVTGAVATLADGGAAFTASSQKGVYSATLEKGAKLPKSITIQVGAASESIELSAPLSVSDATKPAAAVAAPRSNTRERWFGLGGLLLGALLGAGATLVLRLRGRGVAVIAVLAAVTTTSAFEGPAFAHGGEEHSHAGESDTGASDLAGSTITLSKKSQLLLGLRTVEAKKASLPGLLQAYGHIIPKPQNDAFIAAPQAGFVRGLRAAFLGRSVRRGETLLTIQSVNSIPVESPLDGQILEVEAVEGARVEAGAKLLRVTNTSVLWVDAELFQSQLSSMPDVESIVVSVEGAADAVAAKIVNVPTPINEETRTAKILLELAQTPAGLRIGSFARINFALKAVEDGIPVPADAVLNRAGDRVIFVKTGPEAFEPRTVTVSDAAEPGTVVVTRGLAEGDLVVTTGNYQLLMKAK